MSLSLRPPASEHSKGVTYGCSHMAVCLVLLCFPAPAFVLIAVGMSYLLKSWRHYIEKSYPPL